MATFDEQEIEPEDLVPIVHVISDSSGDTADEVVEAAALQFDDDALEISRLPKVRSVVQVSQYFDAFDPHRPTAVFHTIANVSLRAAIRAELDRRAIPSIDLLGPAVNVISGLTGLQPSGAVGLTRDNDVRYLSRIDAMAFVSEHDNEHFEDLPKADAVLFGVTRTSKTPLSLYLSLKGYKVCTATYTLDGEVPDQLFQVDPQRIFGMIPAMHLRDEGTCTLSDEATLGLVASYSDPSQINVEQNKAREIMDKLNCQIVEIEGKSVEVLAQEIVNRLNSAKRAESEE